MNPSHLDPTSGRLEAAAVATAGAEAATAEAAEADEAAVPRLTSNGFGRRSLFAAAMVGAPAIALSVATPAAAASAGAALSVAFGNSTPRAPGSSLADGVATVRSVAGHPVPNETVTLSVTGPAYFGSPGTTTFVTVTNAAGEAFATGLTAGDVSGTVVLTATITGVAAQTAEIAVAVPTGSIAFAQPNYPAAVGATFAIAGRVAQTGGPAVESVALSYSGGLSGPARATVSSGGAFTVTGVVAPSSAAITGTITATQVGLTSGSTQVLTVGGYISFDQSAYRAYLNDPPFSGSRGRLPRLRHSRFPRR
ncbi:hypothetical protein [Curtobacterium ammoniigenes]|uniref:hypothetical protein n=1 Tax=Curtobacterium ammoniigenes TaxID=395387 RepID=UPI000837A5C8|nr:hypothetical protein [Curtobacterium ammoniigenes]